MPRLRVLAGPSIEDLKPIEANSDTPMKISSDVFEGQIAVYIKGFADADGKVGTSPYFEQAERTSVTWSFQVQGRFLKDVSADDVLFGNVFDRPLQLPFGFSAALAFMQYMDPTLEQNLASQTKPWALSPLVSTMPYFVHTRIEEGELHKVAPFPPIKPVGDDTSELRFTSTGGGNGNGGVQLVGDLIKEGKTNRRAFFKDVENRKKVVFGPKDLITTDFAYGYLLFSPEGVSLGIPGAISIDMMKYWDGQPVRFVCCERRTDDEGTGEEVDGVPWGQVFWVISIEKVGD